MKDVSLKSCLIALAALTAAGALLAGAYASYLFIAASGTESAKLLSGNDFRAVVGRLRADGDAASITGHRQPDNYRRAIISRWGVLNADEYRYVSVSMSPSHPALEVKLFWRSADDPDELHSHAFPGGALHGNSLDMHNIPNWRGKISELGLVLETRTEAFPVVFTGLNLAPYQPGPALGNIVSEWTANRGFDQTTINRLPATYSGGAPSPVMAVAAWIGVALVILIIARRYAPPIPKSTFLLLVLPGWVFLDLLWQRQLSQQWELSRHLFAGRSIEARHLRDVDSEFYEHAMQIRRNALPDSPIRLFIVHNSERSQLPAAENAVLPVTA